ncbi:putative reverse transcriptase domain-containing protein [Tanacetum coccineum]
MLPQIVTQVTNNVNNANANGGNGGNGNGGNNGCSYKAFLACNPRDYDGKGGMVTLTRWIEKMELVIENRRCAENQKVKYAASSIINKALTWWNTQVQAKGYESAMGMTWVQFKALLVEEFCPSNEMEMFESEFWNHTMVGSNHAGYTDWFHELAKLVPHLVTPESNRIGRYISRLAPQIPGMVRATQPITLQSVILTAGTLTDEAVRCGILTRSSAKRKEVEETSKQGGLWIDNKKAKMGKGFVATTPPRNVNVSAYPKCAKCFTYHPKSGPCRLCFNCQKPCHFARDFRAPVKQVAPVSAVRMGNNQRVCYECGSSEHLRNTCPKLNRGLGQAGNRLALDGNQNTRNNGNQARGRAFSVNVVDALQDPNVVTANGKKEEVDRIIRDCKLELGNSLFTIDLIPLGHGSFDVIVGMYWLSKNKDEIVCHEKVDRIPLEGGEILRVQGERTLGGTKTLMSTKADEPELSDIPITKEYHEVHLKLVLELLKKERLYAKFLKCEFWLQEVHFLSHVVNHNGIHVDPSKIEAVKNWKPHTTPSKIRSYFGLPSYYRCFIVNFSKIAKPLTSLTQKDKKHEWGVEQEEAFQTLKDNLCNDAILSLPDGIEDFVVYCDTTNQGLE